MSEKVFRIEADRLEQIFKEYVKRVPVAVALAIRSTTRFVGLSHYIPVGSTVLDVGCGDGCFGEIYPKEACLTLDGIDLNEDEVKLARKNGAYREVSVSDISLEVPKCEYDVVIGNCSMEHVPDIHTALENIFSALKPGGKLLLSVPVFGWAQTLAPIQALSRVSTRLGMAAAGALDGFFQHHHLYDAQTWTMVVERCGLKVGNLVALGGESINKTFCSHLPPAYFEFVYKSIFKKYPAFLAPLRVLPKPRTIQEITSQPIAPNSPYLIEYVLEARKA